MPVSNAARVPANASIKLIGASLLIFAIAGFFLTAEAQQVPTEKDCKAMKRKSRMHATYCRACIASHGRDKNSCDNYWAYLDPKRANTAAGRREQDNAAARKAGVLWTSIPSAGTCSFVAQNSRYYRELSAELNLAQYERGSRRNPMSFSARQSWTHDGGTVSGDAYLTAQVLPTDHLFVYLRNRLTSTKFKYYATPSQMTLFANSDRKLIRHPERETMGDGNGFFHATNLSHLNARLGGSRPKQKEDVQRVVAAPECDVAYVLTKFQLCGRIQTFGRTWADGFCGGGLKGTEVNTFFGFTYEDASDVEKHLQTLALDVGEVTTLPGKGRVAHDGTQLADGSAWRIMRVR